MKNLYTILLCLFSFFCFSQENESINDLFEQLNSNKNINFSVQKPKEKQKFCLLSIIETPQHKVFFPFSYDNLSIKLSLTKSSGGNIMIYSKVKKQYLVLNYFSGESITRKSKKKIKLEFNFQSWDLINSYSILLDSALNPIKHIRFPSELNNKSEVKGNKMMIQRIEDNKYYRINLDISFYNISLYQLFDYLDLKNQKEYSGISIEYLNSFNFLNDKKFCLCK